MKVVSLETVSGGVGELFSGSLPTLPLELVNVVHANQCKYAGVSTIGLFIQGESA